MADPFDWSPRNLGPSREERAAAASARALPRRGYTYAANDGLTDRQRRQSFSAQRSEHRRQQRARHRQTMAEARESDRARRRARRDAGAVGDDPLGPPPDGPQLPSLGTMAIMVGIALLIVMKPEIRSDRLDDVRVRVRERADHYWERSGRKGKRWR